VRQRSQDTSTIATVGLGPDGAAMIHILEHRIGVVDDTAAALTANMCNKTDPTTIVFKDRVIETIALWLCLWLWSTHLLDYFRVRGYGHSQRAPVHRTGSRADQAQSLIIFPGGQPTNNTAGGRGRHTPTRTRRPNEYSESAMGVQIGTGYGYKSPAKEKIVVPDPGARSSTHR